MRNELKIAQSKALQRQGICCTLRKIISARRQ